MPLGARPGDAHPTAKNIACNLRWPLPTPSSRLLDTLFTAVDLLGGSALPHSLARTLVHGSRLTTVCHFCAFSQLALSLQASPIDLRGVSPFPTLAVVGLRSHSS